MKRAFMLVELLVGMLISGVTAGAVLTILFSCIKNLELHRDLAQATLRSELGLATVQTFVMNAGMGMPDSRPGEIMKGDNGVPVVPVRDFERPVQLAEDRTQISSENAAPALWTVYSVPSGRGALQETRLTQGEAHRVHLGGGVLHPDLLMAGTHSMKSWVTFPSAGVPLRISRRNNDSLDLVPQTDCMIAAFDELHFVRAAKLFVHNGTLTVDRLDGSGAQPRVNGVVGLWFEFDRERRLLTARVLARSDEKRSVSPPSGLDDWPEDAVPSLSGLDPGYRYVVTVRSWRVRN